MPASDGDVVVTTHIDSSAVVEVGAEIGEDTAVWGLAQIRSGARIGSGCVIGRNVFVDAGVTLGDHCKIQNNALIYSPATLGRGVFVGPAVVLTNDRIPRAVDPVLRPIGTGGWTAAGVVVGDGAALGAGVVVIAGIRIGAWAMVGAGAVVVEDVPDHALIVGNPGRRIGWVGRGGARLVSGDERHSLVCPDTGARFIDHGHYVEPS